MQTIRDKSTIARSQRIFVIAAVAICFAWVGISPGNIAFGQCGSHLQFSVKVHGPTPSAVKVDANANPQFGSRSPSLPCNSAACRSAPAKSIPQPLVVPRSLRQSILIATPILMIEIAPATILSQFRMHCGWRMKGFFDLVDRPPIGLNV